MVCQENNRSDWFHFSTDEQVPPGGVDVSGDDSDVEIVIMDSSDEDQSQEQVCYSHLRF